MKRTVFFVSDGTGITAQTLGHSLMTQFDTIDFEQHMYPYVDTLEKADKLLATINACAAQEQSPPLVFSTLVNHDIFQRLQQAQALCLDFFQTFIGPLEQALQQPSSHSIGRSHNPSQKQYASRIDAINYTLKTDDGVHTKEYDEAEVILIGVSRSGKTPTCLYLAMQYGIKAANYPITEEDLGKKQLPECLLKHCGKLFGLTIDLERLQAIRHERRPGSRYASLLQCEQELQMVERLFGHYDIPFLNTTTYSIEEIATKLMLKLGIQRRLL